jgi:replicative DNA helicase
MTDLLPNNIEAEECILAGILLDSSAINKLVRFPLAPDAFFLVAHRLIYQGALKLYDDDIIIDLTTISSYLKDQHLLKKVGGIAKLNQLLERTISADNIEYYAELVMEKFKRRQLIKTGNLIAQLASDTTQDLEGILNQSEEQILNITDKNESRLKAKWIAECSLNTLKGMQTKTNIPYPTGLTALDNLIGGLMKRDLTIVAARSSMGKTWFSCYLSYYFALTYQKPVVFFSIEMSEETITKRFWSISSGIDLTRLIQEKLLKTDLDVLKDAISHLKHLPILIDETSSERQNLLNIRATLRRIQYEQGEIGMIVLDHLQELDFNEKNRAQELGKITGSFKAMAKDFNCPFVALAQLNRKVESQNDKRPTMADIRDSGQIEEKADLILMLYRDEYYKKNTSHQGIMEIIVAKGRNGGVGSCQVKFDETRGGFEDL